MFFSVGDEGEEADGVNHFPFLKILIHFLINPMWQFDWLQKRRWIKEFTTESEPKFCCYYIYYDIFNQSNCKRFRYLTFLITNWCLMKYKTMLKRYRESCHYIKFTSTSQCIGPWMRYWQYNPNIVPFLSLIKNSVLYKNASCMIQIYNSFLI